MSQILDHINHYKETQQKFNTLRKTLINFDSNPLVDKEKMQLECKVCEDNLKNSSNIILKEFSNLLICHISYSFDCLLKLTYYFVLSDSVIITIEFSVELKKNL